MAAIHREVLHVDGICVCGCRGSHESALLYAALAVDGQVVAGKACGCVVVEGQRCAVGQDEVDVVLQRYLVAVGDIAEGYVPDGDVIVIRLRQRSIAACQQRVLTALQCLPLAVGSDVVDAAGNEHLGCQFIGVGNASVDVHTLIVVVGEMPADSGGHSAKEATVGKNHVVPAIPAEGGAVSAGNGAADKKGATIEGDAGSTKVGRVLLRARIPHDIAAVNGKAAKVADVAREFEQAEVVRLLTRGLVLTVDGEGVVCSVDVGWDNHSCAISQDEVDVASEGEAVGECDGNWIVFIVLLCLAHIPRLAGAHAEHALCAVEDVDGAGGLGLGGAVGVDVGQGRGVRGLLGEADGEGHVAAVGGHGKGARVARAF